MSVLHFTRYFFELVIAWEKQFRSNIFFVEIISPTKPELSLFVVVIVVCFLLSFFFGEVMGLIYSALAVRATPRVNSFFTRISLHFYLKQKPGETLYAELRDLDQRQRLNKPSYPEALPPVKRPSPYERTDYAEITHFIKGDVNGQQQMWSQNGKKEPWIGMQMFC